MAKIWPSRRCNNCRRDNKDQMIRPYNLLPLHCTDDLAEYEGT
jgi:hypothetical protein